MKHSLCRPLSAPLACLLLLSAAVAVRADAQTPEELNTLAREGQTALRAREWEKAIKAFSELTEKMPARGEAWFQLAYATHMSGDLDHALELHKKAAAFPEFRREALYNVACVHALKGRTDDAFEALRAAIDAGFDDAELLRSDEDIKNLREDARFAGLFDLIKEVSSRRTVAILVYDGVDLLDFSGPAQVFASTGGAFRVCTVGLSTAPVKATASVTITPEYGINSAPRADVLVIPGGPVDALLSNDALIAWIKRMSEQTEIVLSVCSGSMLLAKAGLLEGREATTYPAYLDKLRTAAPKTRVVRAEYVDAGTVVTSDGNSGGIDAALHIVEKLAGADVAQAAVRSMAYRSGTKTPVEPQ